MNPRPTIYLILLIMVIIGRLFLATLPGFKGDMDAWKDWFFRLQERPLAQFYTRFPDGRTDGYQYSAGFLYVLKAMGDVMSHFPKPSENVLLWILKLPGLAGDLVTAGLIYLVVRKNNPQYAKLGALVYLVHPALVFNSSIWGQVDSLFVALLLAAFVLEIEYHRSISAGVVLSLAVLTKPQTLIAFPIWFLLLFLRKNLKTLVVSISLMLLLIAVFSSPFFPNQPVYGFWQHTIQQGQLFAITSLYALNLWAIFGWWQYDTQILYRLPVVIWGQGLTALWTAFLCLFIYHHKQSKLIWYDGLALIFFGVFILATRMHERYLFPFFAFALISLLLQPAIRKIIIFSLTSVIYFLN